MDITHQVKHLSLADIPIPAARAPNSFSATETGDGEVVLFDNERLTYHTLNGPAFAVWSRCDGFKTADMIARECVAAGTELDLAGVELAVDLLIDAGLLKATSETELALLDRRSLLLRSAAAAAGLVVLPSISSITSPVAANHTTCGTAGSVGPSQHCVCNSECADSVFDYCCCDHPSFTSPLCYDVPTCGTYCLSGG